MSSLSNLPTAPPPPGVIPNFIDPPTREPTIVALEAVFLPLMLLTVAVRLYVRTRVTKQWGLEDYACMVAACGSVIHMIIYTQMFELGFGRHMWDIRAITFLDTGKSRIMFANGIVYPVTILFAKLSTLLLYLRIFHVDQSLRLAIYFGIIFQVLFYTAVTGVAIGASVKCNRVSAMSTQFCVNYGHPVILMNAAVNAATDIYVLLLPLRRIWKLNVSFKRKLGILVLFSAGVVTCAASLTRLILFSTNVGNRDILWYQARNAELTIIEINLIIIVSCSSSFPSFWAKTKVFYSSLYHSLRSHVSLTAGLSDHAQTAPSQDMMTTAKNQIPGKLRHSDRAKLTDASSVELGGLTTFVAGRNRSGSTGLDHGGTDTEQELPEDLAQEPGMVRTARGDVDNYRLA